MAIDYNNKPKFGLGRLRAAINRIKRDLPEGLDAELLQKEAVNYVDLQRLASGFKVPQSNDPAFSAVKIRDLKDKQYEVEALNREIKNIEDDLKNRIKEYDNDYKSLLLELRDASFLSSHIGYSIQNNLQVFFSGLENSSAFNQKAGEFNLEPLYDPKTGLRLQQKNLIIPEPVASLPVYSESKISPTKVDINWGSVFIGATENRYEYNDPNVLITGSEAFYLKIFKSRFGSQGETGLFYPPRVELDFHFGGPTPINYIEIESNSGVLNYPFSIYHYSGVEWLEVEATMADLPTGKARIYINEEIITSRIRLVFTFFSAVQIESIDTGDQTIDEINAYIKGSGFDLQLNEFINTFVGSIYDFSITSIGFYSRIYRELGWLSSDKMIVSSPTGIVLDLDFESLSESLGTSVFDNPGFNYHVEGYIDVDLYAPNGSKLIDTVVPVINSLRKTYARGEVLPLIGQIGKVNFFPDTSFVPTITSQRSGALVLGTDYEISFDNGVSWVTTWPGSLATSVQRLAGNFLVKIYSTLPYDRYAIRYLPAAFQSLEPLNLIQLKGGSLVFAPKLKNSRGTIRFYTIMRHVESSKSLTQLLDKIVFGVKA